jgi:hypothetical protein
VWDRFHEGLDVPTELRTSIAAVMA